MLEEREVMTYQDLLDALKTLSPEQLAQPIHVAEPGPNGDIPVELKTGIAIGTVGHLGFSGSRSTVDNKYHADEVVLLIDANPYAPDGAIAYPIYWRDGPTPREAQMAPEISRERKLKTAATVAVQRDP